MCRTKSAEETIRFRTWKAYAQKRRFCGYCATLREPEILYPTMVLHKDDILEMTATDHAATVAVTGSRTGRDEARRIAANIAKLAAVAPAALGH